MCCHTHVRRRRGEKNVDIRSLNEKPMRKKKKSEEAFIQLWALCRSSLFFYFIVRSEKPEIFNREKLNAATTKNDAQSIRSHRKSDKKKHVGTMSGEKS